MKIEIKPFITIICIALSLVCIFKVLDIFTIGIDSAYQPEEGFYHERKNSLDAVFLGASSVSADWKSSLAWGDYGIAVWSYGVPSTNCRSLPFWIKEVDKTQPNALLIINLPSFRGTSVSDNNIFRSTTYMRFSANKMNMIHSLANDAGYTGFDQLQFYFPIIRFHSRWSELTNWDFYRSVSGNKNTWRVFTNIHDASSDFYVTDQEAELSNSQTIFLEEFLDFLDNCGHEVLFINTPEAYGNGKRSYERLNRMGKIVQEHGFAYLDMFNFIDEIGLQPDTDFNDLYHNNVHGAIKYTDYLAQYLVDNYGFTDKRGQPGWESWDESVTLYTEEIAPYSLPLERKHAPRDYELQAPVLNKVKVKDQTLTLSWKESPNAEGYDIYRKSTIPGEKNWAYLTSTDTETFQYVDSDLKPETKYTYTVVPKIYADGIEIYGNFNFNGVAGTTK